MAYKPTRMDQIKKIIEYHQKGYSKRRIARLLGMSKNTVKRYLERIEQRGIDIDELDSPGEREKMYQRDEKVPDPRDTDLEERIPQLLKELGRVGVTRYLLWEEYIALYPEGFSYSRFCRKIRQYRNRQNATIKLEHKAAHHLTVDYTGQKISWIDKNTGEVNKSEVLVCTLPYSGYTFACAVHSQKQQDFIHALNECLLYIGGLPRVLLSDNLKAFVTTADIYEPKFAELCIQLSAYYGIDLQATRARKPKDKAHVERHVAIVYNRLFAPLRDEVFYGIDEINAAFRIALDQHNSLNYQGKDYSRKDLFERDEKPHLLPLPATMFDVTKSTKAKVQRNYHVILGEDKHQYSVPYQYIGKSTQVIYNSHTVEIYIGVERIASHARDRRNNAYSSFPLHMPEKHIKYIEQLGWDAPYFIKKATQIGRDTQWAIEHILKGKNLIEQTYISCVGVLRLAEKYSVERLERACARARTTHRVTYGILKNILKNNMDSLPIKEEKNLFSIPKHENIRGSENYS